MKWNRPLSPICWLIGRSSSLASGAARPQALCCWGARTGGQAYGAQFDVSTVQAKPTNRALRYLWARYRIDQLSYDEQLSYSDALRPQITQLGLDYNLLTEYTSFVAIDRRLRNEDGLETVSVPLPLPEGVEDSAVGATAVEDNFEMATWLGRFFYRQDALWVDTSFRLGMPIVEVRFRGSRPGRVGTFCWVGSGYVGGD